MSGYASLIKLGLALLLAAGVALWGRSCGKDAGLGAGEKARRELADSLAAADRDLRACNTAVAAANREAERAAEEADRQQSLAAQAAERAEQAQKDAARRIANLDRQLQEARKNAEAAAQLDTELHPSIPLL